MRTVDYDCPHPFPKLCRYLGHHLAGATLQKWRRNRAYREMRKRKALEDRVAGGKPIPGPARKGLARLDAYKKLGRCDHLGKRVPQQPCGIPLQQCELFKELCTTHTPCRDSKHVCLDCPEHTGRRERPGPPSPVIRYNRESLWPDSPGYRFNPSLLPFGDGYLLAYRHGWAGSKVWLGRLDREFKPVGEPWPLQLAHAEANYGQEDPRLFRWNGRVCVSFIGVVGARKIHHTSQLYAVLGENLMVERVHHPRYDRRNAWEKNWQFFDHDGRLLAVYTIAPHKILEVAGDRAVPAYETPTPAPWEGGEMRGGAAPVRVGDEYYCFFHDRTEQGRRRTYRTGLYTFEARPPFRVQRISRGPLLEADWGTKPKDQYAAVVFAGGAVLTQ